LETPLKIGLYEINVDNNIDEVYKLISDEYKISSSKKDNILGIS